MAEQDTSSILSISARLIVQAKSAPMLKVLVNRIFISVALGFIIVLGIGATASVGAQNSVAEEFKAAADREAKIAEDVRLITTQVQKLEAEISLAQRLVKKSELTVEETNEQRSILDIQIGQLEAELGDSAVQGYLTGDASNPRSVALSVTEELRATSLLATVQKSRTELISELQILREEDKFLLASKDRAEEILTENLAKSELKLVELQAAKEVQDALYATVKEQVDNLETEALVAAEFDAELRELIRERQRNTATEAGALRWPLNEVKLGSPFGMRRHPILGYDRLHGGVDMCTTIKANCNGAPILASGPGTVISAQYSGGAGYTVVIDHGGSIATAYFHMQEGSFQVSRGDEVLGGQVIGKVGTTGLSTGPHLHFEVRENGVKVDPKLYIK